MVNKSLSLILLVSAVGCQQQLEDESRAETFDNAVYAQTRDSEEIVRSARQYISSSDTNEMDSVADGIATLKFIQPVCRAACVRTCKVVSPQIYTLHRDMVYHVADHAARSFVADLSDAEREQYKRATEYLEIAKISYSRGMLGGGRHEAMATARELADEKFKLSRHYDSAMEFASQTLISTGLLELARVHPGEYPRRMTRPVKDIAKTLVENKFKVQYEWHRSEFHEIGEDNHSASYNREVPLKFRNQEGEIECDKLDVTLWGDGKDLCYLINVDCWVEREIKGHDRLCSSKIVKDFFPVLKSIDSQVQYPSSVLAMKVGDPWISYGNWKYKRTVIEIGSEDPGFDCIYAQWGEIATPK